MYIFICLDKLILESWEAGRMGGWDVGPFSLMLVLLFFVYTITVIPMVCCDFCVPICFPKLTRASSKRSWKSMRDTEIRLSRATI